MYPNIKAEQARKRMTNQQVAEYLGLCRNSYENKLKNGKFYAEEIRRLMILFDCGDFEYLFAKSA